MLLGCSVLPDPPAPRIYRLEPDLGGSPPGPVVKAGLAITLPGAPRSLDTDRIALTRGPHRFEYFAEAVWTDRLPALLRTLLLEAFENSARLADVGGSVYGMPHGYVLQTEIRQFEAHYPDLDSRVPEIMVAVDLRLTRGRDGALAGRTQISRAVPSPQNNMDRIVQAFGDAAGGTVQQTVAWTLTEIAHSN